MRRIKPVKNAGGFALTLLLVLFLCFYILFWQFRRLRCCQKDGSSKLKIISTEPRSPAMLEAGQKLYINFEYDVGPYGAVQIWARPQTNGKSTPDYIAHPSPLYEKSVSPKGKAQGYFFFNQPTKVNAIIIRMSDVKAGEYVCITTKSCDFEWKGISEPKHMHENKCETDKSSQDMCGNSAEKQK